MKYLKTVLAVVLAAVMLLSLAGCGEDKRSDEEKILGKWTAELDFSEYMDNMLSTELNLVEEVIPKDAEMNSIVVFEFEEDSCKMYFDVDATVASVESYLGAFEELLAKDLYRQLEEAGLSKEQADEQFKQAYDVTVTEYAELIVAGSMNAEEIAASFVEAGTAEGVYKIEEGKLYVSDSLLTLDSAPYYSYSFDGDKLLLEGASDETFFSSFEEVGITFPIVFEQ